MLKHVTIAALALFAALAVLPHAAPAQDLSKYPDFISQWRRPPGIGIQWDQTKRVGRTQEAPLTPEYQAMLEANLADQAAGGQGSIPPATASRPACRA